jgi:hypothetical protein
MFIAQAADTPQMLRDVGSGPRRQRRASTRLAAISRHARSEKPELNVTAFCQASLAAGISRRADIEPARAASNRIISRQTP